MPSVYWIQFQPGEAPLSYDYYCIILIVHCRNTKRNNSTESNTLCDKTRRGIWSKCFAIELLKFTISTIHELGAIQLDGIDCFGPWGQYSIFNI